jgi:hypothetical protein
LRAVAKRGHNIPETVGAIYSFTGSQGLALVASPSATVLRM